MASMWRIAAFTLFLASSLHADVRGCGCDVAKPETLKSRECSLCAEVEKHPADVDFVVVRDVNPRKPNRWLVLPRAHSAGAHPLDEMEKDQRLRLWQRAIALGQEKFGDNWGMAYNGIEVRTQCHLHVHVGRFVTVAENKDFKFVKRPQDFPAPVGKGLWIHPVPGGFHVHAGEQITESVLVR